MYNVFTENKKSQLFELQLIHVNQQAHSDFHRSCDEISYLCIYFGTTFTDDSLAKYLDRCPSAPDSSLMQLNVPFTTGRTTPGAVRPPSMLLVRKMTWKKLLRRRRRRSGRPARSHLALKTMSVRRVFALRSLSTFLCLVYSFPFHLAA